VWLTFHLNLSIVGALGHKLIKQEQEDSPQKLLMHLKPGVVSEIRGQAEHAAPGVNG